ncbi:restriction endonuclease subunit S [Enterobacter sp. RIT637]|uniref:restriction endonuclease subunit S n=2 Tax=Bacteria TaxID=2 RepID=UPI001C86EFBB|nr:restriction endonuclease subunit S [Enterobacter sp. RIT637]MBX8460127.1 restriction endonuclease subunit S [Enterobacter sp. RIT637]
MVPKGWSVFRLEDIVIRTQLGTTERGMSEDPLTTLIPLIKMGNLGWGSVNFNKVEYIEQSLINDSFLLKKGDFLFNTRNTPDLVGKSAVWDEDYTATFDNNINRIVFNKKVYTNFIAYYLNTGKGKSAIQSLPAGSTSVAAIYWKDLKNIQLLLPSLGEQQKIVQILSTWDKSIVVTGKLLTNSHRQKKALMQQLLTGRKRLGLSVGSYEFKLTHYGSIPKDWDYPAIKEICTQVSEKNSAAVDYPVLSCSKYDGFVDSLKYFNKKVYSDDLSGYRLIHRGCFGFPSNHIEEGSIGLQNLYETGIVSPIYVVFRASPTKVDNSYLYAVLKTDHYKQIFGAATNASVDRRGSLRWKEFNQIHVPLPPLKEQQKIAAVLSAADAEIATLEKKLASLKDEKKALMQQLLTGKLRVKLERQQIEEASHAN